MASSFLQAKYESGLRDPLLDQLPLEDAELPAVPQAYIPTIAEANALLDDNLNPDLDKAIESFGQILSQKGLSPSDRYEALIGYGKAYLLRPKLEHRDTAKRCLEEAVKLASETDPPLIRLWKQADALRRLAIIYRKDKDDETARKYFQEAWEVCKYHQTAALDFVDFLEKQEDFEGALAICKELLQPNPNAYDWVPSADVLYTEAKILFVYKRWKDAIEECNRALGLKGTSEEYKLKVFRLKADSLFAMKIPEEACRVLWQACEIDSNPSNRLVRAKTILQTELLAVPQSMLDFCRDPLEVIRSIKAFPKEAFEFFHSIVDHIKADNQLAFVLVYRAIASIQLGELLESTQHDLEQSLKLVEGPHAAQIRAIIHIWLAHLSIQKKEFDPVLNYLNEALREIESEKALEELIEEVIESYVSFLRDIKKDLKGALAFCETISPKTQSILAFYYRVEILSLLKDWQAVVKASEEFLQLKNTPDDLKLKVLDWAAKATQELNDFQTCYKYSLGGFKLDTSSGVIQRIQKISNLSQILQKTLPREQSYTLGDLLKILDVAEKQLKKGNPKDAFALFNLVLRNANALIKQGDHFRTLIGWVNACILNEDIGNVPYAHANVGQAYKLISGDLDLGKRKQMQTEAYLCRTKLFVLEGKMSEAKEAFNAGWKIEATWDYVIYFIEKLQPHFHFEASIKLCKAYGVRPELQIYAYFCAKQWKKVVDVFESLQAARYYFRDWEVFCFKMAYQSAKEIKDYANADKYLSKILVEKGTVSREFVVYLKDYLEMHKANIVNKHFQDLRREKRINNLYLSPFLQIYARELEAHPRHRVDLLLTRIKLYEAQQNFNLAIEDYQTILTIYQSHPNVFEFQERAKVESLLSKAMADLPKKIHSQVKQLKNKAMRFEKERKPREARASYNEILRLINAHGNLFLNAEKEQIERALKALQESGIA